MGIFISLKLQKYLPKGEDFVKSIALANPLFGFYLCCGPSRKGVREISIGQPRINTLGARRYRCCLDIAGAYPPEESAPHSRTSGKRRGKNREEYLDLIFIYSHDKKNEEAKGL
jgi:hypothetical protein